MKLFLLCVAASLLISSSTAAPSYGDYTIGKSLSRRDTNLCDYVPPSDNLFTDLLKFGVGNSSEDSFYIADPFCISSPGQYESGQDILDGDSDCSGMPLNPNDTYLFVNDDIKLNLTVSIQGIPFLPDSIELGSFDLQDLVPNLIFCFAQRSGTFAIDFDNLIPPHDAFQDKEGDYIFPIVPGLAGIGFSNNADFVYNVSDLVIWDGLAGEVPVPAIDGNFWMRSNILFLVDDSPIQIEVNIDVFMDFDSSAKGYIKDMIINLYNITLSIDNEVLQEILGDDPLLNLGDGFGLYRSQSDPKEEVCTPSGFFFVIEEHIEPLVLGSAMDSFLAAQGLTTRTDVSVYYNPNPGFKNQPTAMSYRYQTSFNLLGLQVNSTIQVAYVSPTEIQRRQNYLNMSYGCIEHCKSIKGGICQETLDPLDEWIQQQDNTYVFGVYLDLSAELTPSWAGDFVKLGDFSVLASFDLAGSDAGDFILYFHGQVSVLCVADFDIYMVITRSEFVFHLEFSNELFSITIDANAGGVGYLPSSAKSSSSTTNNSTGNAVTNVHHSLAKRGSSFLDADWHVSFSASPGPWVTDLVNLVNEAITAIADEAKVVWNDVTSYVEDLGRDIYNIFGPGGELEKVGEAIAAHIEDWAKDIANVADQIYHFIDNFLNSVPALAGLAQSFESIVQAGDDLIHGDFKGFFESVGSAVEDLFYGTEDDHWQLLSTTDALGCPQSQHEWKTCDRIFGIDVSCTMNYGDIQSDSTCLMQKSQAINAAMGKMALQTQTNTQLNTNLDNNGGLQLVNSDNTVLSNNPPTFQNASANVTADTVGSTHLLLDITVVPLSTTSNTTLDPPTNVSVTYQGAPLQADNVTFGQAYRDFLMSHNQTIQTAILNGNTGPTYNLTSLSFPRQRANITQVPANLTINCDQFLQLMNSSVQKVLNVSAKAEYDPTCAPGPIVSTVGKNSSPDPSDSCATDILIGWYTSDNCTGVSDTVYQHVEVLPLPPVFTYLPPQHINITCEASTDPSLYGGSPTVQPSCGGTGYSLYVNDTALIEISCGVWTFTRSWTASTGTCASLKAVYNQTFIIIDKIAPYWDESTFPADNTVDFLQPYGTLQMGTPTSYDSCGKAPVTINYTDTYASSSTCSAEKVITRTWFTSDICGNSRTQNQTITVTNKKRQLSDGSLYQVFSSSSMQVTHGNFEGQIAAASSIKGSALNIGYGGSCDLTPYSVACNTGSISIPQSHVYNGLSKSNAGLDAADTSKLAKNFTTFLKNLKVIHDGNTVFTCLNGKVNTTKTTGPVNYVNANCTATASIAWKYLTPTTSGNTITLRGADPLYNVFNVPAGTLNSASKTLNVDIPAQALAFVNVPDLRAALGFSSITFTNGNSENNIIFSLSSATMLEPIAYSKFGGTIVAPSATFQFTGTGIFTITGQLFVLSYNAQTVVHKCAPFHGLRFCSDKSKSAVSVSGLINTSTFTAKSTSSLSILTQISHRPVTSSSNTGRPVITPNAKISSSSVGKANTGRPVITPNAKISSSSNNVKASSVTKAAEKVTSKSSSNNPKSTPKSSTKAAAKVISSKSSTSTKAASAKVTPASLKGSTSTKAVKVVSPKVTSTRRTTLTKSTTSSKKAQVTNHI